MSSSMGGAGGGSGDEGSHRGKRPAYTRLTSAQTAKLEKFILECPHPDEVQRRQIAEEVGIEPKQVKFWFQNKRTQIKNQHEKADNSALRMENERIHNENMIMREALNNIICPECGGPPFSGEGHQHHIHRMLLENAHLRAEREKVSMILSQYLERQMLPPDHDLLQLAPPRPVANIIPSMMVPYGDFSLLNHQVVEAEMHQMIMEKAMAIQLASSAMDQLVMLLRINEPLWFNTPVFGGKLVINRETYDTMFPNANQLLHGLNARVESSKDSGIVTMSGIQLVNLFLDPAKWVNLFPTIARKAETVHVFENGIPETRSGALLAMYEEMHVLSPMVASREFHFLRCCQEIEAGIWVIADVSYDPMLQNPWRLSPSWRHPSGFMIQDMNNGCSMVTWVEHVEVDNRIQMHRLYRDLLSTNLVYGADRWILELERMCHRAASYFVEEIPAHDLGGVINTIGGRRSMMKIAHRMVKMLCENLEMSDQLDLPYLAGENDSGVRVSVRRSAGLGQPDGIVVIAATSLWLPHPYYKVFAFLTDVNRRLQWDILSGATPVHNIAQILSGVHPGNTISVIQSSNPNGNNSLVLQESFMDPIASYIVYAPTDASVINVVVNGEDPSLLPILPSGFVISRGGRRGNYNNVGFLRALTTSTEDADHLEGSLLTVTFQILVNGPQAYYSQVNMESVASVNTLLTSTVQNIKDALNYNNLE